MKKALVLGGGFAGCTISYFLKQKGFEVTIIEATEYLGGGCRTFFYHGHPYTYGPRHLIINKEKMFLWDYFSRFLTLRQIHHHTMTFVGQDNRFYTFPIHVDEIEDMPDKDNINEELKNRGDVASAKNLEDYWINSVGEILYNKFVKDYNKKMWITDDNRSLDEFAFSPKGVPLKTGSKECFAETMVLAYPTELDGYNSYFDKCTEGCNIIPKTFVEKIDIERKRVFVNDTWIEGDIMVSTVPVDLLFGYRYGPLKFVGKEFLKIILPVEKITPEPYYFIHYASDEPFLRVVEYKLLTGYKSSDTLILVEFPSMKNKLYPYPVKSEIEKAQRYLNSLPQDVYSIGRLGKYHYNGMCDVVEDCMKLQDRL
ncbi:MAG: NAD(P)-binding protein [Nitrospirae bacterium]|nr:NAD(P)-binding protein [Nitrospirota bacterium]MBF0519246.1 NAD(P)-binding protein [Nitrospirota bacterium]MBF0535778.1 NAD(P)-binding protein [Nitrospirota bacterium]MBF0617681.1 NAD(P)-binding protein [Nitrospirota bacterium]